MIGFDLAYSAVEGAPQETKIVTWDTQQRSQEIGLCLMGPDGEPVDIIPSSIEPLAISADGTVVAGRAYKQPSDGAFGDYSAGSRACNDGDSDARTTDTRFA